MPSLRSASREELEVFDALDRQEHACKFINETGLRTHQKNYDDPRITYLSIENDDGVFSGYFILVKEEDTASVEFRRILVDKNTRGVGQAAIAEMENYCRQALGAQRIWLDVYEDNARGMHIYEKLGYTRFKQEAVGERQLLFYEKAL